VTDAVKAVPTTGELLREAPKKFLYAAPLKIVNGTGAPLNPLAIQ
jgi:kynurenine formamidase